VSGALILRGDALHLPIADETVDLVVTSPPYFALRDYQTGHPAEVGSEATPAEFLAALWTATAEIKRVLKPTGSAFINLGDKYSTGNSGESGMEALGQLYRGGGHSEAKAKRRSNPVRGMPPKSLLLLPEAYRLGCTGMLAALGGPDPGLNLIARAVTVWNKTNGMPESVKDRVRRSHDDWVHLVKSPRYYSAIDELREPQQIGKLPGSVWSIPSEPLDIPDYFVEGPHGWTMLDAGPLWRYCEQLRHHGYSGPVMVREIDHYAAFPSEWPRRLILGWSPPGICVDCGHGRFPVVDRRAEEDRPRRVQSRDGDAIRHGQDGRNGDRRTERATILGYACACTLHTDHPGTGENGRREQRRGAWVEGGGSGTPQADNNGGLWNNSKVGPWREYHLNRWTPPPTRPAVVCDPFVGTGTSGFVANALGRQFIGVDLSRDYTRLTRWRIEQSGHGAKALARTNRERQGALL
jgi:DNA modification methylase